MFINCVKNVMKLLDSDEGITDDGTHYLFRMQRDAAKFNWDNVQLVVSENAYSEASEFIREISELCFSIDEVKNLLELYPQVRIALADGNGVDPTSVREGLSFAVAHFFLGCSWPTFGDNVDLNRFVSLLHVQAVALGFKITDEDCEYN